MSTAVDQDGRTRRRGEATGAGGAGILARVVQVVVSIIVFIIVAGILLAVFKANPRNDIVSQVHDWAPGSPVRSTACSNSTTPVPRSPSTGASPPSSTGSSAD